MLAELLNTCGLNETEQTLFASLAQYGPSTAALLAKRTGLKRPTTYAALANMVERGLVVEQSKHAGKIFALVERSLIPSILRSRAETQLREVIDAAGRLPLFLKDLDSRARLSAPDFEVSVLENIEAIYAQLGQIFELPSFAAIFNPQIALVGKGKEMTKRFLDGSKSRRPKIRELIVPGPMADWYTANIRNTAHVVRELPASSRIASDIVIADGCVVILHYQARRELGLKIRHTGFFQTMLELFDSMFAAAGRR